MIGYTVFLAILLAVIVVELALIVQFVFFLLTVTFFKGAFYAGTSKERLRRIIKLSDIKFGQKAVDLGSGDGRIVMALAKEGAEVTGYEINPWMVLLAKHRIKKAGMDEWARIKWQNIWKADLSGFDLIVVYGMDHMMQKLEDKLKKEAKSGARVVSVYFKLPNLKAEKKIKDVYLYKIK